MTVIGWAIVLYTVTTKRANGADANGVHGVVGHLHGSRVAQMTGICEHCGRMKKIKFIGTTWICRACEKGQRT